MYQGEIVFIEDGFALLVDDNGSGYGEARNKVLVRNLSCDLETEMAPFTPVRIGVLFETDDFIVPKWIQDQITGETYWASG